MGEITFNSEGMEAYLQEFNVLYMKYFGANVLPKKFDELKVAEFVERLSADSVSSSCSAVELAEVGDIVEKVYGSKRENETASYVVTYKLVLEKFIKEFVGIEGLDTLYNPLFFVFEWLMHLEYKVEKNSYSYYRDHFIHQIRNMVEMMQLLTNDELGLQESCITALKKGKTLLAVQMRKTVKEAKENPGGMDGLVKAADCLEVDPECDKKQAQEEYMEEAIYTYILLASTVVTAVFHDIGYPIEFINGNLTRMDNFLPASQFFFEKKDSTSDLYRILQDSLLYRTYEPKMIAMKVREGDHGAISACILLMKYYENGKFFSLSPIEKMVIELSAVTIFEHTLKYENIKTGSDKYQVSFEENPFSYLFRLCDDMEEWDRTYFEITGQSNFLLCEQCGAIIKTIGGPDDKRHYACGCGEKGINENIFGYRKLTSVNACKRVVVGLYGQEGANDIYRIELDYDLMALLQASAYSATFAQKRANALREIKVMTFSQSGIKPMYIESFITNNPILIKLEILSRYLAVKYKNWDNLILENAKKYDGLKEKLDYIWMDDLYKGVLEIIPFVTKSKLSNIHRENLLFYLKLLVLDKIIAAEKEIETTTKEYLRILQKKHVVISISLEILVKHALLQRVKAVGADDFIQNKWKYKEQYFDMYESSEEVSMAVKTYIADPLYDYVRLRAYGDENQKKLLKNEDHIHYDYYSDYGIFQKMHQVLMKASV